MGAIGSPSTHPSSAVMITMMMLACASLVIVHVGGAHGFVAHANISDLVVPVSGVNFCITGGGVLWLRGMLRVLLQSWPISQATIVLGNCECIGDVYLQRFLDLMDEMASRVSFFQVCRENAVRPQRAALAAAMEVFRSSLAVRSRRSLWIARGSDVQAALLSAEFHSKELRAAGLMFFALSMTAASTADVDTSKIGRMGVRILVSNPFISPEQSAAVTSLGESNPLILPPLMQSKMIGSPGLAWRRSRHGAVLCLIGGVYYTDRLAVDDVFWAFFKARELIPTARFLLAPSHIYRTHPGRVEVVLDAFRILAQMPDSGLDLVEGGLSHADAISTLKDTCTVGIRTYTGVDADTVFSTKVMEMAASGLPVLLNRLSVYEHYYGADYPYFFEDRDGLFRALMLALEGDISQYSDASYRGVSWSKRFTEENVVASVKAWTATNMKGIFRTP
jgi:hypothetical protein